MTENHSSDGRAVVIGLDGTPFSLLKKEIEAGNLPNIGRLAARGNLREMNSEVPTISSVAWASFMTGKNPAEHGIFGFTDRKPGTWELYFPNYSNLREEPIWDGMSRAGKRCCVINVPSTYPARPVNGVLVSGFVAPNLERATYPREAYDYLVGAGYRIDVDASKGRQSLDLLLEDLHETMEKRREVMLHFWESEKWDFFMSVFTGTDRLHHFMWRHYADNDPVYGPEFLRYYQRLDEIVGEFVELVPSDLPLFMLSDHGFCSLEKEVYLNHFLEEMGLLAFNKDDPKTIADIDPARTKVYCMDPGRLYINVEGREPGGIIRTAEYQGLLDDVTEAISGLKDPESGLNFISTIYQRDQYFAGPQLQLAPDLVAMPINGYDLKGFVGRGRAFGRSHFTGMHTYDDAFILSPAETDPESIKTIRQVADGILRSMGNPF